MLRIPQPDLKNKVSTEEWQVRVDLAACYRLLHLHGWDDLIHSHVTARIPGTEHLLINAFGLAFEEITASNLVKIDIDGNIIDKDCPFKINPAGLTIHSAIHEARHEEACVLHLHTNATVAVASVEEGLLPLSQYSMFALASMSYHDYEGLAVNDAEKIRLKADLADKNFMLLRNHGAITLGKTIGDAFMHMYDLTRACEIQLQIKASCMTPIYTPQSIIDGIKAQATIVHSGETGGQKAWPAMLRRVYRSDPSFAQ